MFYRNNFEAQEIATNNGANVNNDIDKRDGGKSRSMF